MTQERFAAALHGSLEPVRYRRLLAALEIVFFFVYAFGVAIGGALVLEGVKTALLSDSAAHYVEKSTGFWELSIPLLFLGFLTAYPLVVALRSLYPAYRLLRFREDLKGIHGEDKLADLSFESYRRGRRTGRVLIASAAALLLVLVGLVFDASVRYDERGVTQDRVFAPDRSYRWDELELAEFAVVERRVSMGRSSSRPGAVPELTLHFHDGEIRAIDQLNFFDNPEGRVRLLETVARFAPRGLTVVLPQRQVMELLEQEPIPRRQAIEALLSRAVEVGR